ncbi:LysM-like peptidoglycan-binding domain-containing protein [Morganella psychrotolerans]|uniref:LysM-like peptidoglycan-binding domain-containing protein n=1 Tax=Morganella psychrotolerans TaxID=368603 RepID=UPI000B2B4720|nr:LysM-like peptidoglycan-binding domain-containing protein [Morganella psychrotolerans]
MRLLPKFHLYTIAAIALIVIIVLFLWPAAKTPPVTVPPQNITLAPPADPLGDLIAEQTGTLPDTAINNPDLPLPDNLPPGMLTTEPEPQPQSVTTPSPAVITPVAEPAPSAPSVPDRQLVAQRFTVKKGQTIAQVFRSKGLPVDNLFRMAAVEGPQKPLNQVEAGDKIRVIYGKGNTISELRIDKANGQSVTFERQKDGSYRRS